MQIKFKSMEERAAFLVGQYIDKYGPYGTLDLFKSDTESQFTKEDSELVVDFIQTRVIPCLTAMEARSKVTET